MVYRLDYLESIKVLVLYIGTMAKLRLMICGNKFILLSTSGFKMGKCVSENDR